MCNCSKPITLDECQLLKWYLSHKDLNIIYHINDNGLQIAHVPKGKNPNEIALKRGFKDENGNVEWFFGTEHPCINETI